MELFIFISIGVSWYCLFISLIHRSHDVIIASHRCHACTWWCQSSSKHPHTGFMCVGV